MRQISGEILTTQIGPVTIPEMPRKRTPMSDVDLPALDAATLCEAFQLTARAYSDSPGLRTPGNEQAMTYGEWADKVEAVAGGLAELGLRRGDTLALMMTNRPEFAI